MTIGYTRDKMKFSTWLAALTEKTTPADGDLVVVLDSAASNAPKKMQKSNLVGASGGASEGAYTAYHDTSTIVGWSSFTTKKIYYKKIGNTIFVYFNLAGTSNSASTTFTLPDNLAAGVNIRNLAMLIGDNSTLSDTAGNITMEEGSNVVTLRKSVTVPAWTASGTKTCIGQFNYETASA
jgi:hypothetical protein